MKPEASLKFLVDVKQPIASYFEWEIFLNPSAKVVGQDGRTPALFIGKRMIDGKAVGVEVSGDTINAVRKKINTERKSNATFRNKCKTMIIDFRKCEFCADRFLCFTEK